MHLGTFPPVSDCKFHTHSLALSRARASLALSLRVSPFPLAGCLRARRPATFNHSKFSPSHERCHRNMLGVTAFFSLL